MTRCLGFYLSSLCTAGIGVKCALLGFLLLASIYILAVGFTSAQQGHATSSVLRHALLYPVFGCIAYIRFISSLHFVCTVSVCLTSSPRSNVILLFYCDCDVYSNTCYISHSEGLKTLGSVNKLVQPVVTCRSETSTSDLYKY